MEQLPPSVLQLTKKKIKRKKIKEINRSVDKNSQTFWKCRVGLQQFRARHLEDSWDALEVPVDQPTP